jgi:integral membrane protein (TIGR01906 family)
MTRTVVAFVATILVLLALAVLPLLTPAFTHAALDAAGSAGSLGVDRPTVLDLSDRSVAELIAGPATFAFTGPDGRPFYDAAERGHLADARVLLWSCLVAGAVSAVVLTLFLARSPSPRRARLWRSVSAAGATTAIAVAVIAILALVAFESLFTLFHQLAFPGGGWTFDPSRQRLVLLYPLPFWQIAAAALGSLLVVLSIATWWLGRWMAPRSARPSGTRALGPLGSALA